MSQAIPKELVRVTCTTEEYDHLADLSERRIYLSCEISPLTIEDSCTNYYMSSTGQIVKFIMDCNREDHDVPIADRRPIKLYINSPGGDLNEGFALVSAIALSKTPVWTINIGMWSSMSFYIGITGHRRLSLPHMMFLLHDGSTGAFGSTNKVQDRVKFEERFEHEVVKTHVLRYGNMSSDEYDALARVEYYMLPEDALRRGFIDEIVSDIDNIL